MAHAYTTVDAVLIATCLKIGDKNLSKYAVLNVIPFNSLEGTELEAGNGVSYERPDAERIREIVKYLHSRYVLTKVRNSAGQDVDGGCGQLRARAEGAAQRVDMRRLRDTRTVNLRLNSRP